MERKQPTKSWQAGSTSIATDAGPNQVTVNMDEEYETPIDFRDQHNPPGKNATATTSSSVASSSRMASAASEPVNLSKRTNAAAAPARRRRESGGSFHQLLEQSRNEGNGGTATPAGNSFHSSPLIWNSSTPQRIRSRRELEQKIRHRKHRAAPPNFPQNFGAPAGAGGNRKSDSNTDATPSAALPLPKALTDLLLQTAILGIDTTAKLSKPTIELTKNTLLPRVVIPLIQEVWEQYAPVRLQTWTKVVPTSLKNVGNLLWDTEAGQALGEKAGQFGENLVDMASSEGARQCWIDATVALIKLMESLHTPEVKALLDQFAVGACRFVDVLSSGKAKQVWFDASDALWALIEVGSDPVMVMALAEGCAQICFALENERESLKGRRSDGAAAGGGSSSEKVHKLLAANRRRERDRRQRETYPPGKTILREEDGREAFGEALLGGLDGYIKSQEESQSEFEDHICEHIDNTVEDNGPPEKVIVPTSSSENIHGDHSVEADMTFPIIIDDAESSRGGEIGQSDVSDDSESEITTDIEDLRCAEDPIDYDDMHTQSSASERQSVYRQDPTLAYEQGGNVDYTESLQNEIDELEWRPNDDGTASEMYDAFDEPILQFYRKLNEVLVETRKQDRSDFQYHSRGGKRLKDTDKSELDDTSGRVANIDATSPNVSPLTSKGILGVQKKWWRLIIAASICGVASMCMIWFALGCYGFYALFISSGSHGYHHPSSISKIQQPTNIVIQLVTSDGQQVVNKYDASADNEICSGRKSRVTSMTLDDWNDLKIGVEKAIETVGEEYDKVM